MGTLPTTGMFAKGQYATQHQPFKVAVSTATDHGDLSVLKSRQSRRVVRRKNLSLSQITIRPMRKSDVEAAARCWASTCPEQGGVDKLPRAFLYFCRDRSGPGARRLRHRPRLRD